MADGSIRIETKLDNTALKKQIQQLERELNNLRKEQAKVDAQMDSAMARYRDELEFDAQFPEEFSHREDIDQKAAKEIDPIIAKQEELNQKEQKYLAMLDAAKAKLAEQANIASAVKQVDEGVKGDATLGKVQSQAQYNSLLDATAAKMAAIEAHAAQVAAQTGLTKEQILSAHPQYKKLSDTMGMLKASAKDFGNEAKGAGKKADTAMKQTAKSTKKVGDETKRGIAGFGKMQLIMMGIMMATRSISSATREYMATNSKLEGQLNTLKSLWGQVLGPVIEWVVNLFIKAISAVNAFVYALTGINLIARANEAALNKQAEAAGNAAKAQLAGFDEQTKLNDTSSGGGDPVTLLDDSVNNISEKLREQLENGEWYESGRTVGEGLMDGMESVDWSNLGTKVGNLLANVITFILGFALNLNPLALLKFGVDFTSGFMDGISQSIQETDWGKVGSDLIDLLIGGMIAYVITTNPLARLIALIFTPEGQQLTSSASELVGSIIGALLSATTGATMRIGELAAELWLSIKTYFGEKIDWEGTPGEILQDLWDCFTDVLADIGTWVKENIWEPFKQGFLDAIDWDSPAGECINYLYEGIKEALLNAKTWVKENIWEPIKTAFKEAAGINSSSTEMKTLGGYLIDGLFSGITNGISKIRLACETIWTAIKGKFSNVGSWFKEKFSDAWQKVKDVFSKGGETFEGIKEGISSTFKDIVNRLIDGINKIIPVPFNKINSMLNTIRDISVLGVTPFKNLWSYNPLSIPQIPKLALGGIVNRPGRGVPAIIGEAGAEAVLPLENNTEWMDILADKIGGNVTIPIYLGGKKIAEYVVDLQKKKAFAMNGG